MTSPEVRAIADEPKEGDAVCIKRSLYRTGQKGLVRISVYGRQRGIRPSGKFIQPRHVDLHVLFVNQKVQDSGSCDVRETRTDVTVHFSDLPESDSDDDTNFISSTQPDIDDKGADGDSFSSAMLDVTNKTIFYLVLFLLTFTRSQQVRPTQENTPIHYPMKVATNNMASFIGCFTNIPFLKTAKSKTFPKRNKNNLKDRRMFSYLLRPAFAPQAVIIYAYPVRRSIVSVLNKLCSGDAVPHDESMAYETLRLSTFERFPPNKPYSILFAKAGFYYSGNGDNVICYCCGRRVGNWAEDDLPLDIHAMISPNCPFIVDNNSVNFPVTDIPSEITTMVNATNENIQPQGNSDITSLLADSGVKLRYDSLTSGEKEASLDVRNVDSKLERYGTDKEANPTSSTRATEQAETSRQSQKIKGQSVTLSPDIPSKYPEFAELSTRRRSYDACTCVKVSKDRLAEAGFFYAGRIDCSRCFKCGIGLKYWEESDDPWTEHAKHRNTCPFVRQMKGQGFVDRVQQASREAANTPQTSTGTSTKSHREKYDKETNSSGTHAVMAQGGKTSEDEKTSTESTVEPMMPEDALEYIDLCLQQIDTPNRRARRVIDLPKCCECRLADINSTLLPCGHQVCCNECWSVLLLCTICKARIRAIRLW